METPGEYIKGLLVEKDWTQDDFSQILDLSLKHTNELLKDKRNLTFEQISDIISIFELNDTSRNKFIKLNISFRSSQIARNQEVENKAKLFDLLPIGEMVKKGWLEKEKTFNGYLKNINKVLGILTNSIDDLKLQLASPEFINFRNIEISSSVASDNNRIAWYLYAKKHATGFKNLPVYDNKKLKILFENISEYTNFTKVEEGIAEFLKKLNDCGVRFVFLSHLTKTYTEGAAFDSEYGPVIALTGRTNKIDTFWFNMGHEIIHILEEHYKCKVMIDNENSLSKSTTDPHEMLANKLSSESLKGNLILNHFRKFFNYIPESEIMKFSEQNGIHPSIIAGRLAWEKMLPFSATYKYKETIKDKIPKKYLLEG